MDKCSNSFLVLVQKAICGLRQVLGKEVSVLETQVLIDGAMEYHVRLIFNMGGKHTEGMCVHGGAPLQAQASSVPVQCEGHGNWP